MALIVHERNKLVSREILKQHSIHKPYVGSRLSSAIAWKRGRFWGVGMREGINDVRVTHCGDSTMGAITSQITSLTIVYSTVYSDADQGKYQGSASLAFVRGIHGRPVNSPHKWPVTRKIFPFDDVIMLSSSPCNRLTCCPIDGSVGIGSHI